MLEILNNKSNKELELYMKNIIKEYTLECKIDKKVLERKSYQVKMINEKWKYINGEIDNYKNGEKVLYEKTFLSHGKAVYWSVRNVRMPWEYALFSMKKAYFSCNCGHDFESTIANVSRKTWCPFCSTNHTSKLCDDEECKKCYSSSFASYPRAVHWSALNKIKPRYVISGTSQLYKFNCEICLHTFDQSPLDITNRNNWCSYCAGKKLCESKSCKTCEERSFANHKKAIYWHEKNNITPRQAFKKSSTKYWFTCDKCNHVFDIALDNLTMQNCWCYYCNKGQLCNDNECEICFNNSFASYPMAKYWSIKNIKTPRMVFKFSYKKYIFDCFNCDNEYVNVIATISSGHWCSCTVNKTETKLYNYLLLKYNNIVINKQQKFAWCVSVNILSFDFCIEEYKLIIELDGVQHFEQVSNWKSPEYTQQRDKHKMICANNNGYSVIRLLQTDVWYGKGNWERKLCDAINLVINGGKVMNILIGDRYEMDYFEVDWL